jgi:hypothetical protein
MKFMRLLRRLLMFALCSVAVSCRTTTEPVAVSTPPGFVAATEKQKELAEQVRQLTRGMSKEAVIERLGRPANEQPQHLTYMVIEDAGGGHYVEALLVFDDEGLESGKLGFGHIDIHMLNE